VASQRQQAGNGWQQLMAIALNGAPLPHLATVMTAAPLTHSGRRLKLTKRFPKMPFWLVISACITIGYCNFATRPDLIH
jgi:hypothetical protein